MITTQHIEEDLSRAYIQAVAAKAGLNLALRDRSHDYGIDGTFHQVSYRNGKREESGFSLDFQLKSSINATIDDQHVSYDLDVKAFNSLVERAERKNTSPTILILLVLPKDQEDWIALSEDQLILKKCCYWTTITGATTPNKKSQCIKILRSNLLTPENVILLIQAIENGEPLS